MIGWGWIYNPVWDNETKRDVCQVAVGMAFLAVKKIQKIRLHFLPLLTKMSAWNSSCLPVLA